MSKVVKSVRTKKSVSSVVKSDFVRIGNSSAKGKTGHVR